MNHVPTMHEAPADFSYQWEYSFLPYGLCSVVHTLDMLVQQKTNWEDRLQARIYTLASLFLLLTCPSSWYFLMQWGAPHSLVPWVFSLTGILSLVVMVRLILGEGDLPSIAFVAWGFLVLISTMIILSGSLASGALAFLAPLMLMASDSLKNSDTEKLLKVAKFSIILAAFSVFLAWIFKIVENDNALDIIAYCSVIAIFAMLLIAYINLANTTLKDLRKMLNTGFDAETCCLDIAIFEYLRSNSRFCDSSSVLEFKLQRESSHSLKLGERRSLVIELEKYLKKGSLYFYGEGASILVIIPFESRAQLNRIKSLLADRLLNSQTAPVICKIL